MTAAVVAGGNNGPLSVESPANPETLLAPVTLANQASTPAAPAGAVSVYSSGGKPSAINPQGLVTTLGGSVGGGLTAAPAAITTTTSETVLASLPIPANDPAASAVYKMTGWGVFSSTGTPGNTVFTLRLGGVAGTSLVATANIALTASLTNAQFELEAFLNFYSPTSVQAVIKLLLNTAAAGAATSILAAATAAVTVATSTAKTWVTTITPGASGNSIQLLGGWGDRIA
jgi:hypothetical protein